MLAVELDWTVAPYAVAELADDMARVVAEIAAYRRRLRKAAAA